MTTRAPADAAADSGQPGTGRSFGKYEILRRIAVGGMAEIHLARARGIEGFEKLVVIKRILPQYADNEEFVQMFLDEARLAAHLHHSNVVQVYDIGQVDQQYFLSMEFLHGQDVRQVMKAAVKGNEPVPLRHALTILVGVLAGLHYAHTCVVDGQPLNLVHRDISPQNVFVTFDGGVKLLDFGIARASSRLSETRTGTLKGKTSYMSPEQCNGLPLDRRSDVFAAAIMLWELTTGRRLYTGDSELETLRKIKEEDPPRPSAHSFAYPLALEKIVLKGLKRNWDQRYQSAEEMQIALEGFAREQGITLSPMALARYLRELFPDRADAAIDTGEVRELSHPSVASRLSPPLVRSDPAVPAPAPSLASPSRSRSWLAVVGGVAAGSLVTWLLVRPTAAPVTAPAPVAARAAAAPAPVAAPAAVASSSHARELPAPAPAQSPTAHAAPPVEEPAEPKRAAPSPVRAAAPKPPVRRPARATLKPRKSSSGWDPDSMLPP